MGLKRKIRPVVKFIGRAVWHVSGVTVAVYLIAPIVIAVLVSFYPGRRIGLPTPQSGYTLDWYFAFLSDPNWRSGLYNSLYIGGIATAISLVGGLGLALAVVRYKMRKNLLMVALLMTPIFVPASILGMQTLVFSQRVGLWGTHLIIAIAHALWGVPLAYLVIKAGLSSVRPEYDEAAAMLGANAITRFRLILLPLISPSLMAAGVLAFVLSVNEFLMAVFLATPATQTLPVMIWPQIRHTVSPLVAAASGVLLLITVVGLVVSARLINLGVVMERGK